MSLLLSQLVTALKHGEGLVREIWVWLEVTHERGNLEHAYGVLRFPQDLLTVERAVACVDQVLTVEQADTCRSSNGQNR